MVRQPAMPGPYFVALVLLAPVSLGAQPGEPEVFVHAGMLRIWTTEGVIGNTASFGGGISVPVNRRLAAEVDGQTGRRRDPRAFRRGSSDAPHARARQPAVRVGQRATILLCWPGLGVSGGRQHLEVKGLGCRIHTSRSAGKRAALSWIRGIRSGAGSASNRAALPRIRRVEVGPVYCARRAGFVLYPLRRLGLRADIYPASWHLGVPDRRSVSVQLRPAAQHAVLRIESEARMACIPLSARPGFRGTSSPRLLPRILNRHLPEEASGIVGFSREPGTRSHAILGESESRARAWTPLRTSQVRSGPATRGSADGEAGDRLVRTLQHLREPHESV